jgi:hypothetical protein
VRVSGRDAYGNGPTVGDEVQFKTKAAVAKPGEFPLTTERFPYLFFIVVVAVVAVIAGIYIMNRRRRTQTPPT